MTFADMIESLDYTQLSGPTKARLADADSANQFTRAFEVWRRGRDSVAAVAAIWL